MATAKRTTSRRRVAAEDDLPDEIIDLSEYTESQNWCIYGDSGIGKTVLLGQLPNSLILAIEPGTVSAARRGGQSKVWPIRRWNDLVKAYEWLEENPKRFTWVGIDSAPDLQRKAMRDILKIEYEKKPSRDPDIPEIKDYLKLQQIFKRFVEDFNDLPINICWTSTAMFKEDQEGDEIVLPAITGKDYEVAQWFCAQQNVVAYYGMEPVAKKSDEMKRYLLLQKSPPYFAKNRYDTMNAKGQLVRRIELGSGQKPNTTFDKIVNAVYTKRTTNSNTEEE